MTNKTMGRPKGMTSKGKNHSLSLQDLTKFKQVISSSPKHDCMFSLALFYGLRVAEIAKIKISDINLSTKEITIQGVKGGRERTYSLPPSILKKFTAWLEQRSSNEKAKDNPYLFPHRIKENACMSREGIQYDFRSYCAKVGIKGHSVHSLRHTCAMLRVKAGVDPIRLRNWLRQRQIQSTQKYFEEFEDRLDDKIASKTEGLL